MSPDDEPLIPLPTIIEEKLSAVEFKVTVPVLVKLPEAVIEASSLIVRVAPETTVKFPWAKVVAVNNVTAKNANIFFIS
ncbi:MAG: Uncharacterised protein [Flavobacteriaceae bacterium]|nr:MAG: Uncharacterised protein [Flavobacteriaceae bacterium]